MDLELTPRQDALRQQLKELVTRHCPPAVARELDERGRFPHEFFAQLESAGLCGLLVPAEHGGAGAGLPELAIACEELAHASAAIAVAYGTSALSGGWAPARFGTAGQPRALAAGGRYFALAAPDEHGGTTAAAQCGENRYRLRATQLQVPGADAADQLLVVARSDAGERGGEGLSLFYVPRVSAGVRVTAVAQMGGRAVSLCEVDLDDVVVTPESLLGPLHRGGPILDQLMDAYRLVVAAASVGLAQETFESALAHARQPRNSGPPPAARQAVQHALAALHTRIEAARLLVYHAAWCAESGSDASAQVGLAKGYATAAANQAVEVGMRIAGPAANRLDCDMQRYFRDARPLETLAGSPEADKDRVAGSLGL